MTIKQFDCKNITSNDSKQSFPIIFYWWDKQQHHYQPVFAPAAAVQHVWWPLSQVGAGPEPEPHGAPDQDLVPEQEDEVQEELAAADGEQRGQLQLGLGGRRPPASSGHSDS